MSTRDSPDKNTGNGGEEQQPTDSNVLPDGGEIHFHGDRDVFVADRIVLLDGWVKAVNKQAYTCVSFPAHDVSGVHTHTKHLEDKEWW